MDSREKVAQALVAQQQAVPFQRSRQLADLVGSYIDQPNLPADQGAIGNPTNALNPSFPKFAGEMQKLFGTPFRPVGIQGASQPDVRQFGQTYNPPEYRGIRWLLPDSESGMEQSSRQVPGYAGLQQELLGEMIRRGYPVLGGVGQLPGFRQGFNPVGFGQR